MGAHWLFVIPIAVAYLLKHIQPMRLKLGMRLLIASLALGVFFYNMSLIVPFMLQGFVAR